MKKIIVILAVLSLAGFSQIGYSAGGPMVESLDTLVPISEKAISAGKQGDADAFLQDAKEALTQAQGHPDSAKQQRILGNMKKAVKLGEGGKLEQAVAALEAAVVNMK